MSWILLPGAMRYHLAVQIGTRYLKKMGGGRGVLLGGVPAARVVILGGSTNAAKIAVDMRRIEFWYETDGDLLRWKTQLKGERNDDSPLHFSSSRTKSFVLSLPFFPNPFARKHYDEEKRRSNGKT
jgi:hypothetical protein